MLAVGCEYTERIVDCTPLGAGIAKIDGCAVFVGGALSGEKCRFEITEVHKRFATARLLEIVESSCHRQAIDCPVFGTCGGCTLRHTSPSLECDIKRSSVIGALRALKPTDALVRETAMPSDARRNGAHFHFDKDGSFGFFEEGSSTLCRLPESGCMLLPREFCDIARDVSRACVDAKLKAPQELFVRRATDGRICVCVTGDLTEREAVVTAESVMSSHSSVSGFLTRGKLSEPYRLVQGERHIESRLSGLCFRISPEAFFQVNYKGAELLFDRVLEYASRCEFSYCADLYCGTGTIGIMLAAHFPNARFTGVEINESAVRDAKFNAKLNGVGNIDFYCDDAARFASEHSPELTVLDPPRRGLSQNMLATVLTIMPQSIIYVSCNPFTLARDLKALREAGYAIRELSPINMFPRSSHTETVCLLARG